MGLKLKDRHVYNVIEKFKKRSEIGVAKYQTTLEREDLTFEDWVKHAQEEAMDFVLYLERIKSDIQDYNKSIDYFRKLEEENAQLKNRLHYETKRQAWHY